MQRNKSVKNSAEKESLESRTELNYCIHAKIIKSKLSTAHKGTWNHQSTPDTAAEGITPILCVSSTEEIARNKTWGINKSTGVLTLGLFCFL